MKNALKNVAASVRQRLYNLGGKTNRPFEELLQYYAMERFLYRLSKSKYADKIILKGALMFVVWKTPLSRATRDIDLLGRLENKRDKLAEIVKEICKITVEEDGLTFDPKTIKSMSIKEDAEYEGVRIKFMARLGQPKIFMQIDFGFGDTIFPEPSYIDYPTMFEMPKPRLKGYPRETVVAEKFQAMVELGILNSRMKDFYDIWLLANQFNFSGSLLRKAISETFAKRHTPLTAEPLALSEEFTNNKEKSAQWNIFIRKSQLAHAPKDLKGVIKAIKIFMIPLLNDKNGGENLIWHAPGPWSKF